MSDAGEEHDPSPGDGEEEGNSAPERSDSLFDRWLQSELQAEFGSVAAEPIPDTLLKLIESHRQKRL